MTPANAVCEVVSTKFRVIVTAVHPGTLGGDNYAGGNRKQLPAHTLRMANKGKTIH